MDITEIELSKLKKPKVNVRRHSERQIAEYVRSVEKFGQMKPIVVDEDGVILAGNGLFMALSKMGKETAQCYVVKGLSEADKKKFMLADNKIFDLGMTDIDAFDQIVAELSGDLDIPGYDKDLLSLMNADLPEVDKMVEQYGRFEEKDVESNIAPSAVKPVEGSPMNTPTASEFIKREPEAPAETRKCVVCPSCGETIWL